METSMILTVILCMTCQIIGFVCVGWLIRLWADRKQREIERRIDAVVREWFTPPAEGQPHKFAEFCQTVGVVVGQAAAKSIMASLQAEKSHVARLANGVSEGIEAQNNPILGLLSGGKRGKGAAVAKLMELVGSQLGLGNPGNGSSQAGGSSLSDRLRKGG